MTRYPKSGVDTGLLDRLVVGFGARLAQVREVEQAATARRACEVCEAWRHGGLLAACTHRLGAQRGSIGARISEECGRRLRVGGRGGDFRGRHVVAATEARWVTWQSR